MIEKLEIVNQGLVARGMEAIKIGVGVNTGPMIVGNIGSEKRLDYTLIGDNVNLGSRLEGLTKKYHVPIIVSGSTYEKTLDEFVWVFVDEVAVNGRETGVKIYAPLAETGGNGSGALAPEIEAFGEAHDLYIEGNFIEAGKEFTARSKDLAVLGELSGVFAERCRILTEEPPEGKWNGIWKMLEK
jgi:adenylate cyclase